MLLCTPSLVDCLCAATLMNVHELSQCSPVWLGLAEILYYQSCFKLKHG